MAAIASLLELEAVSPQHAHPAHPSLATHPPPSPALAQAPQKRQQHQQWSDGGSCRTDSLGCSDCSGEAATRGGLLLLDDACSKPLLQQGPKQQEGYASKHVAAAFWNDLLARGSLYAYCSR